MTQSKWFKIETRLLKLPIASPFCSDLCALFLCKPSYVPMRAFDAACQCLFPLMLSIFDCIYLSLSMSMEFNEISIHWNVLLCQNPLAQNVVPVLKHMWGKWATNPKLVKVFAYLHKYGRKVGILNK